MPIQELLHSKQLEIETGYLLQPGTSTKDAANKFPITEGEAHSEWTKEEQLREYVLSEKKLPSGKIILKSVGIIYLPESTHVRFKKPIVPKPDSDEICAQYEFESVKINPNNSKEMEDAIEWALLNSDADPKLKIKLPMLRRIRRENVLYFSDGTIKLINGAKQESQANSISDQSNSNEHQSMTTLNNKGILFKFDIDKTTIAKEQSNSRYRKYAGEELRSVELEAVLHDQSTEQLPNIYQLLLPARRVTQERFDSVGVRWIPGAPKKSRWTKSIVKSEIERQIELYHSEKKRPASYSKSRLAAA